MSKMIKAYVKVDGLAPLVEGDILEHGADGNTRTQSHPEVTPKSFARVIDPTPGETAPDGSYRVRCEMLVQRPFIPKHDRTSA